MRRGWWATSRVRLRMRFGPWRLVRDDDSHYHYERRRRR